ncbi:hypothetical protein [Tropicimonas aquimaris]|uniref:Pilus assembly protein PilP n=1 Tax=Tropicimonas aquimaris TaxID=914152 RepID=A0ABW3IK80_9RHOB
MSDNALVASAATQKNEISLNQLALIGVFGTETDRRALLRQSSGRIVRVQPGQRVGGATIVGIGASELILKSGSGTRKLEMPSD